MNKRNPQDHFPDDIKQHTMEIVLDMDTHRHLKFSNNGSFHLAFEIVTWPGYLTICGDMGTYTFQRTPDMFKFFRRSEINPDYWTEKLQATDKGLSHLKFHAEIFCKDTMERCLNLDFETTKQKERVVASLKEVLSYTDESPFRLLDAVMRWECDGFSLEMDGTEGYEYSYHYIWCLLAIVWGISRYDFLKKQN